MSLDLREGIVLDIQHNMVFCDLIIEGSGEDKSFTYQVCWLYNIVYLP